MAFTREQFLEMLGLDDLTPDQYASIGTHTDLILLGLLRKTGQVADNLNKLHALLRRVYLKKKEL